VFEELSMAWDPERMDALLLVAPHARAHNHRGKGDFQMDPQGRLARRRSGRIAPFIYIGIQIVSHRLLRDPPEGPFSTNVLWSRALEEGRLFGTTFHGQWAEVGEPGAIRPTEELLARG
jgi:MurNAc alpha-1-phosphate uridylyltransferase